MGEIKNGSTFVKWAGGKKQLLNQFIPLFPDKIKRYFEPFVGGGAVLFHVIQEFSPKEIIVSDTNEELINAYNVIRDNVRDLIEELKKHKENYDNSPEKYFYKIRKIVPNSLNNVEKAARFIFLNRTCFNGLYRVNKKGEFNVPIGKYENPDIVREETILEISKRLKNVKTKVISFEKILEFAKGGDFIYFDPPYWPLNTTSFTSYTKLDFKKEDQEKLAEVFKKLDEKGCKIMLSNSDTPLIHELYKGFDIKIVKATRMINAVASGRGAINEVVVRNY